MKNAKNFNRSNEIERNGIYWCDFPELEGESITKGYHPCYVYSNNKANKYSPLVTVIPISSKTHKYLPTHLLLDEGTLKDAGLGKNSIIMAEGLTLVSKFRLKNKIGQINNKSVQNKIDQKIDIHLGRKSVLNNVFEVLISLNKRGLNNSTEILSHISQLIA